MTRKMRKTINNSLKLHLNSPQSIFVYNAFNEYLHCRCLVILLSPLDCLVMVFCWLSNPKFKGHMLLGLHFPGDRFPAFSNRQQRKNPLFRHGWPIFLSSSYFDQRMLRYTLISFSPACMLSSYVLLSWFVLLLCFCFLKREEDHMYFLHTK